MKGYKHKYKAIISKTRDLCNVLMKIDEAHKLLRQAGCTYVGILYGGPNSEYCRQELWTLNKNKERASITESIFLDLRRGSFEDPCGLNNDKLKCYRQRMLMHNQECAKQNSYYKFTPDEYSIWKTVLQTLG